MQKDVEGFLKELTELTHKYGIQIGGCGCCGSPYLLELNSGNTAVNGLQHDELTWTEEGYVMNSIYQADEDEEVVKS